MSQSSSSFKDKIVHYFTLRLRELSIGLTARIVKVMGYLAFLMIIFIIFILGIIFLGLGTAEAFCSLTGSKIWGYFITSGIFLILALIFNWIKKPVILFLAGKVAGAILNKHDKEDH